VRRRRPASGDEDLVDAGEIARRLGLRNRSVVLDWRLHRFHFPAPVIRRRTYLWRWADVEAWSNEHSTEIEARRPPDEEGDG
jgi:hypothetical protein